MELNKTAKALFEFVGIYTADDLIEFKKREMREGESLIDAMWRYYNGNY